MTVSVAAFAIGCRRSGDQFGRRTRSRLTPAHQLAELIAGNSNGRAAAHLEGAEVAEAAPSPDRGWADARERRGFFHGEHTATVELTDLRHDATSARSASFHWAFP